MADGQVLAVGAAGDAGAVFAALSAAYTVHADPPQTLHWTWLDTHDWRVHRAGLALREQRHGRARNLVLDAAGTPELVGPVSGTRWPARLDQVNASDVREQLTGVVGVRALLPVAEVETRRITLRLMDGIGKTRVRVAVEQQRLLLPRRAALPLHIVVRPLRGCDRDARRCVDLLAANLGVEATAVSPTDAALAAAGHLPGARWTAAEARPDDPAVRPLARALLGFVEEVDDARDGALADLDTEFLHDLRTSLRATRSLVAAAGVLLPGQAAARVSGDLARLDERTAPLRAVDIALLELAGSGGLVLDDLDADVQLDTLARLLQRRRRTELRRMRQALRAPNTPAAFTAWRDDLDQVALSDPIGPTAAEAAPGLIATAYDGLLLSPRDAVTDRVHELDEVLRAYRAVIAQRSGDRLIQDVGELRETLRRRDGTRILRDQVAAAAATPDLQVQSLLVAGAVLDRARSRERALDARVDEQLATLTGSRSARRVAELAA